MIRRLERAQLDGRGAMGAALLVVLSVFFIPSLLENHHSWVHKEFL